MDVTPRYLGGGSFLGHRDPRVLLLVPVFYLVAVARAEDLRIMLVCSGVALAYYLSGGIPWREARANWMFFLAFAGLTVLVNSLFTNALQIESTKAAEPLFEMPLTGNPVSVATLSYSATLLVRYVSLAMVGFPIAFCVAPGDLGVAFARFRVSQRLAFGVDLTFRFIPSTAAKMGEIIDAQRVRGYTHPRTNNPIKRLISLKPVVIPLTVNSLIDAEDTSNAMDLRGFGAKHRTWMRELAFDRTDRLLLAGFAAFAVAALAYKLFGTDVVWVP
ncbi:energy-coupling factor transporter transmembrane protein EcfT [Nonomuraea sp. NBC_01738]|uniref:energy-coupling factor transporter transmembrane component T family protein n=1 Tax=Nonomuraea sp. NBC_01738 TaxID=2976003 RepID=UPI002E162213|nr:energy-coupling factor transporter transmembrane protein EcfT [Nonomuraea sp. NBC_01738]